MAQPQAFSLDELKTRMQKSIASLKDELAGLRTGRASPSLLEPVTVEAYGSRMPLNQVATVTVPEARMLSVQVWDRSLASAVEKAIRGMLPKNSLGRQQLSKLKVYVGAEHPHAAQQPTPYTFDQVAQ